MDQLTTKLDPIIRRSGQNYSRQGFQDPLKLVINVYVSKKLPFNFSIQKASQHDYKVFSFIKN